MGGRNKAVEVSVDDLHELRSQLGPSKVVIVTGPSFGSAIKFILLGAVIGAGAVHFLLRKNDHSSNAEDSLYEGLAAGGAKNTRGFGARLDTVMRRTRVIASRARDAAHVVADAARPAIENAIQHGKAAAQRAENEMEEELENREL